MISAFFNENRRADLRKANAKGDGTLLREGRGWKKPEPETIILDTRDAVVVSEPEKAPTKPQDGGEDLLRLVEKEGWKFGTSRFDFLGPWDGDKGPFGGGLGGGGSAAAA